MNKTETIEFITGTFLPEEAREILLQLLDSKINFHNQRNFSSRERIGKPDSYSEQRLENLIESRKKVLALVSKSINEKRTFTITSIIEINIE